MVPSILDLINQRAFDHAIQSNPILLKISNKVTSFKHDLYRSNLKGIDHTAHLSSLLLLDLVYMPISFIFYYRALIQQGKNSGIFGA